MEIKTFRMEYIIAELVISAFLFGMYFYYFIVTENIRKEYIYLTVVVFAYYIPLLLYDIGFKGKKYYINNNGIYVTWLGFIRQKHKWEEFQSISVEVIRTFWGGEFKKDTILCCKIPLKHRISSDCVEGYINVVDYEWVFRHPNNVITLFSSIISTG